MIDEEEEDRWIRRIWVIFFCRVKNRFYSFDFSKTAKLFVFFFFFFKCIRRKENKNKEVSY